MTAERQGSPQPDAQMPMTQLLEGCRQLKLALDAGQLAQFEHYYQLLAEWNQRLNLTAITGYAEVQTKHFLDSLVCIPLLTEELGELQATTPPLHLVDVGTGAGLPGIPLKIALPGLRLTLMDGTHKKIIFLEEVVAKLGLADVSVVHGRAEELGRLPAYRAQFDLAVARAVAPLNTLVEYLLPMVREGGLVAVYKGPGAPQEFMESRGAVKTLGGEPVRLAPVTVPFLDERRFILLLKKVRPTPAAYPRGQGLPRKRPLG